jgi:hypothetical protein
MVSTLGIIENVACQTENSVLEDCLGSGETFGLKQPMGAHMSLSFFLAEAFRKYNNGDSISDDEIVEMLKFLEPVARDGWTLDARFTFFVEEIIVTRLQGYMNIRIAGGRWHPTRDIQRPKFLEPNNDEEGSSD